MKRRHIILVLIFLISGLIIAYIRLSKEEVYPEYYEYIFFDSIEVKNLNYDPLYFHPNDFKP